VRGRAALLCAAVACLLGLGHAAVSAYWAAGGTALLDTIGGNLEDWGRRREPALVTALWLIAALKTVVAVAAPVLVTTRLPAWTRARLPRILAWTAAIVLILYGGVLTVTGLLVEAGLLDTAPDADRKALAWHTYLWDPWFLLWGLALAATLTSSRSMAFTGRKPQDRSA
jgi:Protein of unknown function (DUF3995)